MTGSLRRKVPVEVEGSVGRQVKRDAFMAREEREVGPHRSQPPGVRPLMREESSARTRKVKHRTEGRRHIDLEVTENYTAEEI